MVTIVKDWVVDFKATKHICENKSAFTFYNTVNEGDEQVFMVYSRMSPMIGNGIFSLS